MKIQLHVLVVGACLLVGACKEDQQEQPEAYQPTVEVEVNPTADFASYMTFDIVDPAPNAAGDPPRQFLDFQTELEDAIVGELSSKGLVRDRTGPQLLINPLVNVHDATDAVQFYESCYGWYWGYEYLWTVQYDYTEGSLVIDVVDRGNPDDVGDDLLIYRGAVHGLLAQDSEVIDLQLRNAIQAIFAEWPTVPQTGPQ